ncbi:MAG: hypothetical protein HYR73_06330 [Candidatus Eisenbacteria bacterium]|nr:hypothetical protein [Candidatus Eisenbacteria bacterium]
MISKRELAIAVSAAFLIGISLGLLSGMLATHLMTHERFGSWHARRWMMLHGPIGWGEPMAPDEPMPPRGSMTPGEPPGPGGPRPVLPRLERALDLSPPQRDTIEAILLRSRGRFRLERDSLRREIEAQLTPEQRQRWHQIEMRIRPGRDDGHHGPPEERP